MKTMVIDEDLDNMYLDIQACDETDARNEADDYFCELDDNIEYDYVIESIEQLNDKTFRVFYSADERSESKLWQVNM